MTTDNAGPQVDDQDRPLTVVRDAVNGNGKAHFRTVMWVGGTRLFHVSIARCGASPSNPEHLRAAQIADEDFCKRCRPPR